MGSNILKQLIMYGYVADKLPEGTYVGMWQIQDGGWTIEVIEKP